MALSALAAEMAAGIAAFPWEQVRMPPLSEGEAESVRLNVMWVTAQVLGYNDPNLDLLEFARACGCTRSRKFIESGVRRAPGGGYVTPGELLAASTMARTASSRANVPRGMAWAPTPTRR